MTVTTNICAWIAQLLKEIWLWKRGDLDSS